MSKMKKYIMLALGAVITMFVVYTVVMLFNKDIGYTVVPGWHTTIYSPEVTWAILTLKILVISLLVYLVFKGATTLLRLFWKR